MIVGNDQEGDDSVITAHVSISSSRVRIYHFYGSFGLKNFNSYSSRTNSARLLLNWFLILNGVKLTAQVKFYALKWVPYPLFWWTGKPQINLTYLYNEYSLNCQCIISLPVHAP